MARNVFDEFSQSFDASSQEQQEEDQEAMQGIVDDLSQEDLDDELNEFEKCLAKASYYKVIVRDGIVEEDGSPLASEVNAEARLWARQQMGKLIGRHPAQAPQQQEVKLPFTPNQLMALKRLADLALAKTGEVAQEPQVRRVEAPVGPTVRKVAAPVLAAAKPKASSSTPDRRTQKTGKPAAPAKKPSKPILAPTKKNGEKNGEKNYDAIPSGEIFEEDGVAYKFVDNRNFDPDKKGSKPRTKIKMTAQVRGQQGFPPITGKALEMLSAQHAAMSIEEGASASASSPFGSGKFEGAVGDIMAAASVHSLNS